MFFDFNDFGMTFHLFSLQHLAAIIIFIFIPVALVFLFRNFLRTSKAEPAIRISIGIFGMLLEFTQYGWYVFSGGVTDWRLILPTTLCGLSIYLSCYSMITLSKKISPVLYFYAFGAFFSFLFVDMSFGYNRFRFYAYFIIHGLIIFDAVYLRVVHGFKADSKALKRACIILFPILIFSFVMNHIFDMNFFYLSFPIFEDFPVFQQLYDLNRYWFTLAVCISYYLLMLIMYGIAKLTKIDRGRERSSDNDRDRSIDSGCGCSHA